MPTEQLYLQDAYLTRLDAVVTAADDEGRRVALDRTVFYATGGGQPHDTGVLRWAGGEARVAEVRKDGGEVWHRLEGDGGVPAAGAEVTARSTGTGATSSCAPTRRCTCCAA